MHLFFPQKMNQVEACEEFFAWLNGSERSEAFPRWRRCLQLRWSWRVRRVSSLQCFLGPGDTTIGRKFQVAGDDHQEAGLIRLGGNWGHEIWGEGSISSLHRNQAKTLLSYYNSLELFLSFIGTYHLQLFNWHTVVLPVVPLTFSVEISL